MVSTTLTVKPALPVLPCASYTAAMLTAQGILAALHQRERTGHGQKVSVSLLSSLMLYDLIMWIGWQLRGDDIEASPAEADAPRGGMCVCPIAQPAMPSGPCRACATVGPRGKETSAVPKHRT